MFGLMRPSKNCGQSCEAHNRCHREKIEQRTHYCGTCKTIGKAYGHKARMLLNFDTVFLAELLSQLSGENIQQWAQPYQAINKCFVMPENEADAPASLQFVAAANVVLGALKMDDNIRDTAQVRFAQKRYKLARWFFSSSFKKAAARLETWGVSQNFLWAQVDTQSLLEKQPFEGHQFADLNACLDTFAAPTARMTAEIFAKGTLFVQKPAQVQLMQKLGYEFGRLAYVLDAFEDIEKDIFNREFNPIAQFFGLKMHEAVPETVLAQARAVLETIELAAYQAFAGLELGKNAEEKFMVRLSANLSTRIYKQRTLPRTFSERLQHRWKNAKNTAEQLVCRDTATQKLKYMMVAMAVFALPQVTEHLGASEAGKGQILGWFGLFSAMLAGVGLSKAFWAAPLLPQAQKEKNWWHIFSKKRQTLPNDGNGVCCSGMDWSCDCEGCCEQSFWLIPVGILITIAFFVASILPYSWMILLVLIVTVVLVIGLFRLLCAFNE